MGNEMKYDPVTGQPLFEEVEVGEMDQQVRAQYDQQYNTQSVQQPVYTQMQQGVQQPVYQQQIQPDPYQQMVTPQSQQPQTYVQPLNQRQPGYGPGQAGPQLYVSPQVKQTHPDETDPEAKKLLLATIISFAAAHLVPRFGSIFYSLDYSHEYSVTTITSVLGILVYIASLIMMIILRVKYPQNKGGKIMMIVMIAEIAVAIFAVAILFASCAVLISSCEGW